MKRAVLKMVERTRIGGRLTALHRMQSYLDDVGWFRSRSLGLPVDKSGKPLPWFTYPAISFLDARLKSEVRVFEYGSGNSTLWWSDRTAALVSCEHDQDWYALMKPKLSSKVEYVLRELAPSGDYADVIKAYTRAFDIVVIDGRDRVACARNSLGALVDNGIIVWDNSERSEYQEGYAFLIDNGFRRLDFHGLGPVNTYAWCTSVFYRPDNCLGI